MHPSLFLALAIPLIAAIRANAESHVIKFINQCGYGSPALMFDGKNILTGDEYTSSGPFSGIAYLQTGYCNTNGENCTLMEMTLINPTCAGCGSSADISLIPPHAYSVETSFAYYNGCDGAGQTCSDPNCSDAAFFAPNDNFVQVECQNDNVNLLVSFCAGASQFVLGNNSSSTPAGAGSTSGNPVPSSPVPGAPTLPSPSVPAAPSSAALPTPSAPKSSLPTPPATPTAPVLAPVLPSAPAPSTTSAQHCRVRPSDANSLHKRPTALPARAHRRRARRSTEH